MAPIISKMKAMDAFAADIDSTLGAAAWIGSIAPTPKSGSLKGVLIETSATATDADRNAAVWLANALGEVLPNIFGPIPSGKYNQAAPITITIGKKP